MKHGWDHILTILEKSLNPGLFRIWIKPLEGEVEGSTLRLYAPNQFVANCVRERLMDTVAEAAERVLGRKPTLDVVTRAAAPAARPAVPAAPSTAACPAISSAPARPAVHVSVPAPAQAIPCVPTPAAGRKPGQWRFSFDGFVVGPSNQLAFAASQSVCQNAVGTDQLFLCSAPGLGKTHLLQAIGQYLAKDANVRNPNVKYLTAEGFATRMITALKMREIERFKAEFRNDLDILLLEDVHFLQGKEKIQAELLETIKTLRDKGKKVVFTSSFLPRELSDVDPQLASRLGSGFLAHIEKPDFETRRRIVEHKGRTVFSVDVPDDISSLLAERLQTDIRQLESCLQNLILKARLMNERISLDLAQQVLANYDLEKMSAPDIEAIVEAICKAFSFDQGELSSKSRKRPVVLARNTAFFLARKYTDLSLKEIGDRFNRRHSTVIKGITNLERELSMKTPLGRQIERTISMLDIRAS